MTAPAGYLVVGSDLVRRGCEGMLAAWRAVAARPPRSPAAVATAGRGGAFALAEAGGRVWLKPYRHGGLLGGLLGDVYWDRPPRPVGELRATLAARAAGVVAPEVLAAIVLPLGGPAGALLHRGLLVTRELGGRRSLAEALCAAAPDGREALLAGAAAAIARLHGAGIRHRDLNATNLLVGAEPGDVAVIDFDGAAVAAQPVGPIGRALARRRLSRSVAKLGLAGLDRHSTARLLRGGGRP